MPKKRDPYSMICLKLCEEPAPLQDVFVQNLLFSCLAIRTMHRGESTDPSISIIKTNFAPGPQESGF